MSTPTASDSREIALVLGSGGARGLAHIGAIRALEEAGYRIKAIAGSSMGALVGGIYAAGKLDDYAEWICSLDQTDVFRLVDWSFSGGGLIRGRRILKKLEELVGDVEIESLQIEFTAVAVDIDAGREIWLASGSMFEAIRSSIAIPGLFTPHRYRGRTLVDGGILNPMPVAPTMRCLTDLTVAINVNGKPGQGRTDAGRKKAETETSENNGMLDRLRDFIDGLSPDKPPRETQPGLVAVLIKSLETMEQVITRQHLAVFRPDLIIEIPRNACMIHEFHRGEELIRLGEELASRSLSEYGTSEREQKRISDGK